MVHINIVKKQDEITKKHRMEKLHIETAIYIRCLRFSILVLFKLCNDTFGFSNPVKGLFHLDKTLIDLRIRLDKIAKEEIDIPLSNFLNSPDTTKLEELISSKRSYKINFKILSFEKLRASLDKEDKRREIKSKKKQNSKLSISQYRMIERINILLGEAMQQLNMLVLNRGYDKNNQRTLFLAIDRIDKWYGRSKEIFDKGSKHCDRMREIIRLILMASKFDIESRFYNIPREIIKTIISHIW